MMIQQRIAGKNGYDIPCLWEIKGKEEKICIVSHGFGSSKESPTAQMLLKELPKQGIGVVAFDFPAHGESPVDGEMLRIETCMQDLAAVEQQVLTMMPEVKIVYFSSSFGAYINLLYLSEGRGTGLQSFCRSAAVNMPDLFLHPTEEAREQWEKQGYVLFGNSTRPIQITEAFLNDLECHDLFQCYQPGKVQLYMIHGAEDETIPVEQAKRFALKFDVPLTIVPGGDHSLSIPSAPQKVLQLATTFFQSPEKKQTIKTL